MSSSKETKPLFKGGGFTFTVADFYQGDFRREFVQQRQIIKAVNLGKGYSAKPEKLADIVNRATEHVDYGEIEIKTLANEVKNERTCNNRENGS